MQGIVRSIGIIMQYLYNALLSLECVIYPQKGLLGFYG